MDVNQSEKQYQLIEKEMTRLQQDLQANIKRMHQYELELNKAKNQLSLLNQSQESLAGFSDGAKRLLQKSRTNEINTKFVDLVSKLNVDEKYEKAITAALGDAIDVLVLENETINPENLQKIVESINERVALIGKSTIETVEVFKTFKEISQYEIISQAALRQRYIDQSQSLNVNIPSEIPIKDVNKLFIEAWRQGVKTLYYQRSSSVSKEQLTNIVNCTSCES